MASTNGHQHARGAGRHAHSANASRSRQRLTWVLLLTAAYMFAEAAGAGGLLVNLACAWLLHGEHTRDLNVRGAWLHVLSDALGSVGAIAAGVLVIAFGWYAADPLFSALIAVLIVWSSWNLIREAT